MAEASNFEDGIAVLGVMLESSVEDNPDLNPIIENLVKIRKAGECSGVSGEGGLVFSDASASHSNYFQRPQRRSIVF